MEPPRRTVKSYVLRQGRVSNAQQRAWETLFPRFGIAFSDRPLDIPKLEGSYQRAKRILDWVPRTTLNDGIRMAVSEWRDRLERSQ